MKNDQLTMYLQSYFGYTQFRQGQHEIVDDILRGRDVLGVLPTGTGKSLCYQLPCKLLSGTTLVISPLISLMMDQVNQLKANHFKRVAAINSFVNPKERAQIYQNLAEYDLLYVSPELIQQEALLKRLVNIHVPLFVIDEAHCISQWGHEFRPDYLKLSSVIKRLDDPVVLALSATATKDVQQDIMTHLNRPNMEQHIFPMDRENIMLAVEHVENNQEKLATIQHLFQTYKRPGIIYFSSRRAAEDVAEQLRFKLPAFRVAFYHGGMEQMDRVSIQQQFMLGELDVICCTSAFGMGIDKKDIRFVIHYHMPQQLTSYVQEIGRAGRDGKKSLALLLFSPADQKIPQSFIQNELPSPDQLQIIFDQLWAMKQTNEPITDHVSFAEKLQLNEIQWRFLYYQLEKHDMITDNTFNMEQAIWKNGFIAIQQLIEKRVKIKQQKLAEMLNWVHMTGCLREHLYTSFQDTYVALDEQCCNHCGLDLSIFQLGTDQETSLTALDWQTKLQKLLLGEHHETAT